MTGELALVALLGVGLLATDVWASHRDAQGRGWRVYVRCDGGVVVRYYGPSSRHGGRTWRCRYDERLQTILGWPVDAPEELRRKAEAAAAEQLDTRVHA